MPKKPFTMPGTDAVADEGDADTIGIMDVLGKLGGNDARPQDPIAEDGHTEDLEIETPKGMP
jgi:hypothetical protein